MNPFSPGRPTEAITKKKNEIRDDYQPNQEYTSVITAVAGDKNAFGYTGYSYLAENSGKVKSVKVGGIEPTAETIEDGSYAPLRRSGQAELIGRRTAAHGIDSPRPTRTMHG